LFKMFNHIRSDQHLATRNVFLFMDNVQFHHHSQVLETCRRFKVNVLFNA
jgi:hypothetical protein